MQWAGEPYQLKVTTIYPTGKTSTSYSYGQTINVSTKMKASQDLPRFTPGSYLVKPYHVGSTEMVGETLTAKGEYRRYDGVRFMYEWNGPLGASLLQYNAAPLTHTDPSRARSKCLLRAYGKVDDTVLDGGVELGELKETLNMLRSPFKDLRSFLRDPNHSGLVKRVSSWMKNPRQLKRDLKISGNTVASTWLEYRYGVRPLVSTISDLISSVGHQLEKASGSKIRRKSSKIDVEVEDKVYTLKEARCTTQYLSQTKLFAYAHCFYLRTVDQSPSSAYGLDWTQIPEIAWELTRLSFVLDWFFTVGPWLKAVRYRPSVTLLGGVSGYKSVITCTMTPTYYTNMGSIPCVCSGHQVINSSRFQRFVHSGPGRPAWQGTDNLDLLKIVDSLSLLWGEILHHHNLKKR